MKKLRIGIWVTADFKPSAGGGFGYYERLIENLKTFTFRQTDIIFISHHIDASAFPGHKTFQVEKLNFQNPASIKFLNLLYSVFLLTGIKIHSLDYKRRIKDKEKLSRKKISKHVDLIYYPTPDCPVTYFPFIYTLWDLGHVSTFAFPEVSMDGAYEARYKHHTEIVTKAFAVFCESQTGKEEASRYLKIYPERIQVVPLFSSRIVEPMTIATPVHSLKDRKFIHYPAQYWAHKNHYNLIMAFKEVIKKHPQLKLVLTGGDKGNKNYIMDLIRECNLQTNIVDLGFVSIEELKWIYLNSSGLVMPTYLGPTNMPLVEAAELNCPVACSDLPGHREQLEDYAIYFSPENTESITNAIMQMLDENHTHYRQKYTSKNTILHSLNAIEEAFIKIKNIRFTWSPNSNK
jgi:glycosyltransferase involved in cell wall biosynthesis